MKMIDDEMFDEDVTPYEVKKAGKVRDGRICVCGHGARAHGATSREYRDQNIESVPAGSAVCSPGRHQCGCTQFQLVGLTSDIRHFMSKTIGPGLDHALARGVMAALGHKASVHWRTDLACRRCHREGLKMMPVAVKLTDNGPVFARETTDKNYLMCRECREGVPTELDKTNFINVSGPRGIFE